MLVVSTFRNRKIHPSNGRKIVCFESEKIVQWAVYCESKDGRGEEGRRREEEHTTSAEHNVEVHAVDADVRVVLDAQVDVLLEPKPKVTRVAEVPLS